MQFHLREWELRRMSGEYLRPCLTMGYGALVPDRGVLGVGSSDVKPR